MSSYRELAIINSIPNPVIYVMIFFVCDILLLLLLSLIICIVTRSQRKIKEKEIKDAIIRRQTILRQKTKKKFDKTDTVTIVSNSSLIKSIGSSKQNIELTSLIEMSQKEEPKEIKKKAIKKPKTIKTKKSSKEEDLIIPDKIIDIGKVALPKNNSYIKKSEDVEEDKFYFDSYMNNICNSEEGNTYAIKKIKNVEKPGSIKMKEEIKEIKEYREKFEVKVNKAKKKLKRSSK